VKGARVVRGFAGIAIFAAGVALLAQKPAVQTLRVVGGGMPIRVARMNGILAKYGIEVQTTAMNSSEVMRADLADGKEDIAESGLDNGIAMVANGVADIILVDGSAYADQELVAQPGIKSAAELRGKTLIVDATNTQNALMLKKILLLSGLKEMADYKFVSGYVNRFEEMRKHKEYAAGMLGSTQARVAEREGFVSLGTSAKLIGPLLNGGAFVRREIGNDDPRGTATGEALRRIGPIAAADDLVRVAHRHERNARARLRDAAEEGDRAVERGPGLDRRG